MLYTQISYPLHLIRQPVCTGDAVPPALILSKQRYLKRGVETQKTSMFTARQQRIHQRFCNALAMKASRLPEVTQEPSPARICL